MIQYNRIGLLKPKLNPEVSLVDIIKKIILGVNKMRTIRVTAHRGNKVITYTRRITPKQIRAAKSNIKKARNKWMSMSHVARAKTMPTYKRTVERYRKAGCAYPSKIYKGEKLY